MPVSMPLHRQLKWDDAVLTRDQADIARGISIALNTLLDGMPAGEGWYFHERLHPLAERVLEPSLLCVLEFTALLVHRLQMDVQQSVMAYLLLERVVVQCGGFSVNTLRPMLLAASVVAIQVTIDETISLREVALLLRDKLPACTPRFLAQLQAHLLETLRCAHNNAHFVTLMCVRAACCVLAGGPYR